MKDNQRAWQGYVMFVSTVFIIMLSVWYNKIEITQSEERIINHIDSTFSHRARLDTLYWNHLEDCAYELREGTEPDKNN